MTKDLKRFILLGLPNAGKSSLFTSLSGVSQKIANFPGITVEKKIGTYQFSDMKFEVVDLPGIYSLDAHSLDEKVTQDYVLGKQDDFVDGHILVLDATNLKKGLYLALQIKELKNNIVIALNMSDVAKKRGMKIDVPKLSQLLDIPVICTTATSGEGVEELKFSVANLKHEDSVSPLPTNFQQKIKEPTYIKEKFSRIESILSEVILTKIGPDTFTEKVDRILLHPVWGLIVLAITLISIFQLLFIGAEPFMDGIEAIFNFAGQTIQNYLTPGYLSDLLVDGIIAGVGGILVFLPHIVFLYFIISLLEDIGYLGRAAFLLDYIMRRVGLPGRAVVPLLSSHACAIPGIMAARIISNPRQRLVTMMIAPLTTCSARLPVYALLIAAIIPNTTLFGFIGLQGLVLALLYMAGIGSAFIVSFLVKKISVKTSPAYLLLEMPAYRAPRLKAITLNALSKGYLFLKKAGSVILVLSVVIWAMVTFPRPPENPTLPDIEYSAAARIGKTVSILFKPMGLDWKLTTALIPSFAAREVLVSALGTVMAINEDSEDFESNLQEKISKEYSLATLLSLLVWFIFAPQCIATYGVLKKETGGHKMPMIFVGYTLALAYIFSSATYFLTSLLS